MDTHTIRDHIEACLSGGALGDALGYEIEFERWASIQKKYGINGIRDLVTQGGKALVSDDTQMTLFTAEGMLLGFERYLEDRACADMEYYIYQSYLCWLQTQGGKAESIWDSSSTLRMDPDMHHLRAPGNTCLSALRSGRMGTIEKPVNNSKGCGGVMRTAPLGFLRHAWNSEELPDTPLMMGAKAAAVTHGNPMGWVPAGMLSDIISRCLYDEYRSLEDLVEDSLEDTVRTFADIGGIRDFESLMRRAILRGTLPAGSACEIASIDEPVIRSLGEGWTGDEALAIAVYAVLRYPDDMKKCLAAAVNHGGDSDSTGAIAGNILGAWQGPEVLPEDWISRVELVPQIREIADQMIPLIDYSLW